ncbi:chorismate pyruvate-lyase family protein [Streptomyces sp. NPDC006645]
MVFSSAATRILLSGDGMTTPLLQALVHGPLRARAEGVRTVRPAALPPGIDEALRPDIGDHCLLRRSRLLTVTGQTVSENTVVARSGVDPRVDKAVTDPSQPIGFTLAEAEVVLRRRIVHVGRAMWPDGTPCAVKTYTLDSDGRPLLYIRELFNPAVVDVSVRVRELPEDPEV